MIEFLFPGLDVFDAYRLHMGCSVDSIDELEGENHKASSCRRDYRLGGRVSTRNSLADLPPNPLTLSGT